MWWLKFWMIIQSFAWTATGPEKILLMVGERRKIPVHGDLLVGAPKVLKARDLGSSYEIEGLKPGSGTLRNGSKSIEVSVLKQDQFRTFELLRQTQIKSLGLKAVIENGDVVLSGKLLTLSEWTSAATLCANEDCEYKSRFATTPRLRSQIHTHFAGLLQSLGFGVFRFRWEPEIQILVPPALKNSREVIRIASAYGITVAEDAQALDIAPSIRVQIMIVEMKKSESLKYGLKWPNEYTAKLLPKRESGEFLMSAQFYESAGIGRVLANPSLLCRSGKESEFLAGGEIPIKILNYRTQDVVWKRYGILLKLKPLADFSGRMSLAIETEISSMDNSIQVDGIPGFRTNRVQSHFDLSEPRTIVLSGLIKNQEGSSREGLPLLSRVPVLGSLFSSRDFQSDRTELVILVRPELVLAHEQGDR